MIIYGSKMYGKRELIRGWGQCEGCGKYAQTASYFGRKWGHIYFIPLIPMGGRVRVVQECSSCSRGMHIPEHKVPDIVTSI